MALRKRTRKPGKKAFMERLLTALVADVESVPDPAMPELDAAVARLQGGAR